MDAIILAAGLGARIRDHHVLPKGLIKIGSDSIIEESIQILRHFGINRICIVTGYLAETYKKLSSFYSNLDFLYNPDYRVTGSLYSWYLTKNWIQRDFLLLESDILYAENIIERILNSAYSNVLLVSEVSGDHDAVFVESSNNFLINMNKNSEKLNWVSSELIGISKISHASCMVLMKYLQANISLCREGHYEIDGLIWLAKQDSIYCEKIMERAGCEIDDIEHLRQAKKMYFQLRKNSVIFNARRKGIS